MSKRFTRLTLDFAYDDSDSQSFTQFLVSALEEIEESISWGGLAELLTVTTSKLELRKIGDAVNFKMEPHQHADPVPADYGDAHEPTDEITDDFT